MRRSLQPYEFCVPAAADQVRTARRQVLSVLGPGHPCADSVSTVVSELVTNAVIHGSGAGDRVRVKVRLLRGSRVMVAVTDSGGGSGSGPRLRFGGAAETNGRGLFIVSALAEQWTVQSAGAGHRVRVVLAPGTDEGFCEGTKMVGDLATFPEFADLLSDVDGV
ncbi:ATP-binding protein [Thermomonospora echinospora]|nr:ATP-binding protein [Thermomonospora echinospora]